MQTIILAEKGDPFELEGDDFGLHHPLDYILPAWNHYRLHGNYPTTGGYDYQDPKLIEDFGTLNRRYNYWTNQLDTHRNAIDWHDEPAYDMGDL